MRTNTTMTVVQSLLALVATPISAQHRNNVITAQEIAELKGRAANAFDAVQSLRPRWLRARDVYLGGHPSSMVRSQGAHVYLNDLDQGDVEYLKTIPIELVVELRWISATEAGRYGPTNGPGIVVTLKIPGSP